ncbi:uncharacterized protein LOC143289645 [Babylonia areolata]|uniref:uncharacterized protein LOC143289645 n=1 Tax=Babylonia areolata TaxID=304850 RepID=UPI003FD31038
MKHLCGTSVRVLLFFVLTHAQTTMAMWTYRVAWPEGEVTSYTYPRTPHGDCLYDVLRGRLICMRNHGYQSVVNTWLYDPDLIVYVSVRCLVPHPYMHHVSPPAPTCVCKDRHDSTTLATVPDSSLLSHRGMHRCQLEDLTPSMLDELDELEVLDLSHNLLQRLSPSVFASLRALRVLSLASNPLRHLPERLVCPLESLEVLNLRRMQLTSFPAHVFRCDGNDSVTSSVRWLDISGNQVSEMPAASLWYLSRLVLLNVSDNLLHVLPAYPLLGAPSLTTLSMARNLLREIPQFFCEGAPSLRRLSLRSNAFTSLALASLNTCQNLTHLDLTDNLLSSLPAPPASLPGLQHLGLSHNRLTTLNSPLVKEGGSMITLDLSHNDLKLVSKSALGTMVTLVHLDLQDNALNETTLDLAAGFVNLTNLQTLDMSGNQFTSVTGDDFGGLTSLQTLDLSRNRIGSVSFGGSTSLTRLTHLNLSANQMTSLQPDVLLPLISLRVLDVSKNLLHHVTTSSFRVPATLLSLDLSSNSLKAFSRLSGAKHVQHVDLSHNALTRIGETDLQGLPELSHLNLAHNALGSIHTSALAPLLRLRSLQLAHNRLALNASVSARLFSGLRHLKTLNLSHNHLFDAQVLFQSDSLTSLVDLDVSFNAIGRIRERLNQSNRTMHLEHLNLEGCRLREVGPEAFSHLIYLRSVNLQNNKITRLPLFLTHPGIKYHFRGNPLTCDCHLSWMTSDTVHVLDQTVSTRDYDVSTCRTLPRGHLRSVRDVPPGDFLCVTGSARCPGGCTCYGQREAGDPEVVFCAAGITAVPSEIPPTTHLLSLEGGWLGRVEVIGQESSYPLAVKELYLNNSGVTEISPSALARLPSLELLHLDHNHLEGLPSQLLAEQFNLTSLVLSHNRLLQVPAGLLSDAKRLQTLDLSHNSLTLLSAETVHELKSMEFLHRLRLSDNPWKCSCENADLFNWVRTNLSRVQDSDEIRCEGDDNPSRWLTEVDEGVFECGEDGGLPKWVIGVVFIGLPLLVLIAALAYRFRRVLAAVLYARFGLQCVKPQARYVPLGRVFDASVLYDHSDRKCHWWVEQILLPRLTSSSWRLRVHVPRAVVTSDSSVVDNAVYSVRQSAVCVVLVSKHFGAHQHTVTCLAQALQQAQSRPASLVLITWGELTKQTLECGIRPFLGKAQHLPITSPFFWDRLLYLLPSPHPAAASQRRPSLMSVCRLRSFSDLSATSDDKAEAPSGDVTHHV